MYMEEGTTRTRKNGLNTYNSGRKNVKFLKRSNQEESCGEFRIYCKGLMKRSLITGFPEIAEAASTTRRVIKTMIFLVCTAGFLYQTYSFVSLYLEYPTIVNKENTYSYDIEIPAVTVCRKNRLMRKPYCAAFPERCETVEDKKKFCNVYPNYCPKPWKTDVTEEDGKILYKVVKKEYRYMQNNSNEYLDAFGQNNASAVIPFCQIKGPELGYGECKSPKSIQVQKNGFPFKCFSVGAHWGEPDAAPDYLSPHDGIVFVVLLQPEEYFDHNDLLTAYVYVHHPRYLANPLTEGIPLSSFYVYELKLSVERRESLPAPYSSNCRDYMSMWVKNGGYGPLTKEQCVEVCQIKYFMDTYGCIGPTINFPFPGPLCPGRDVFAPPDVLVRCSDECLIPCKMDFYSVSSAEAKVFGTTVCDLGDINCRNNVLGFVLKMEKVTIETYKHVPKFESIELCSYIGGYMGMWLGISFVSLSDLGEMMFDLIIYPFEKRNQKRSRRVKRAWRASKLRISDN